MSLVGPPAGSHYRQQKRVMNAAAVFEEGRHLRSYLRNTSNVSKTWPQQRYGVSHHSFTDTGQLCLILH